MRRDTKHDSPILSKNLRQSSRRPPPIRRSVAKTGSIYAAAPLEVCTCVGGVISPLLANIFLHDVIDQWFEREVKPRLAGK